MASTLPLILVPGLGADRRLFREQSVAFENLILPDWLEPERGDTLASYSKRLAARVDPGTACFVGGCSLGGMLALEMSRHLEAKACFLISSIRSPKELPWCFRLLKPLASVIPGPCGKLSAGLVPGFARTSLWVARRRFSPALRSLLEQCAAADPWFMWWAAVAICRWQPSCVPWPVPVAHIHGDHDRVLPHQRTQPDVLIRGATHLAVMTHAEQVNAFLQEQMERLAG
jgi:pimeloyl-ACP methyl ester carboxylesterase